ncbi:IucA/IucC family protein [Paenibacillus sp. y28]|uniref:IucA/IucC family protein n=1 Tax=Paenibacillus sp. y28 TaxID=3129110 RepID=UPI0030176948
MDVLTPSPYSAGSNIPFGTEEGILSDLINAFLAEAIWAEGGRGQTLPAGQWEPGIPAPQEHGPEDIRLFRWQLQADPGCALYFPVVPGTIQAWRYLTGSGIYEVFTNKSGAPERISPKSAAGEHNEAGPIRLDAMDVFKRVTKELYGQQGADSADHGASRLLKLLGLSLEQTRWAAELAQQVSSRTGAGAGGSAAGRLIELERIAAFRDRPFHPAAKAKGGWTQADYAAYSAESGRTITLQWVAVRRSCLLEGKADGGRAALDNTGPAQLLLSPVERQSVEQAMARQGLSAEQYMALPVHPWQLSAVLPQMLPKELASGVCVPLELETGHFLSTSSARSLAPLDGGPVHVKLPLGIVSLGAVRYLPAVHMMNGDRGQRLLEQARQTDPVLKERLLLCDESNWWAYLPEGGDLFDDPPRHLSALVRQYPAQLFGKADAGLIPMSALAARDPVQGAHVFEALLAQRGQTVSEETVLGLFGEVCREFFHISLRLFRLGVMPEIHGQNAVLIMKQGRISGMLLRDHDSVRLHLPWMVQHGLADPCYKMKPGYPNSLYNETPQKLLFYVQTLGIQVNLYAILETVAGRYGLTEQRLWHILKERLLQAVELADLPQGVRAIVEQSLLHEPRWPWKNIMKPLLEQQGSPSGSMPSGFGEAVNPFLF